MHVSSINDLKIELVDEECYTLGSVDNTRAYDREIDLTGEDGPVFDDRGQSRTRLTSARRCPVLSPRSQVDHGSFDSRAAVACLGAASVGVAAVAAAELAACK